MQISFVIRTQIKIFELVTVIRGRITPTLQSRTRVRASRGSVLLEHYDYYSYTNTVQDYRIYFVCMYMKSVYLKTTLNLRSA